MASTEVTMTMRDLDRLKCIQGVVECRLKLYQAAERLGLTTRQVRRLVRRYATEGPIGLISRHRHRTGNGALQAPVVEHVLGICGRSRPILAQHCLPRSSERATRSGWPRRRSGGGKSPSGC